MASKRQRLTKPRGLLRIELEHNQEWLEMFSPGERNKILRRAAARAASEWRYKYLRRRLEARTVLKYPFNYKHKGRSPMIKTGMMIKQIWKGQIKSTANTKKATGLQQVKASVGLPAGHAVTSEIARVLKIVPKDELKFWAQRTMELAIDERKKAELKKPRKGQPPKLRLSNEQRKRFGMKPRRQRKTTRRRSA